MRAKTAILIILPALTLFFLVACPAAPPAEEGVRKTIETGLTYVRAGEYDRVWTLYSDEFRQTIIEGYEKHRVAVQGELAKGSAWIDDWVQAQFQVTPKVFVMLTPREMDARAMMVMRDSILGQKIMGSIIVEGETAEANILQPSSDSPARMTFILRDGRWLFHGRDFMPVK